jgi:hypothetical protein
VVQGDRVTRLSDFVTWVGANIRGDEKGEAQIFLDRFFRAFGHDGAREAGATLEDRIKKAGGKGTSFADLVWKPVVLIEMKKRGEDLARHYRQAFDYWTRLVPGRPRYVILCNFDDLWIFDFDVQMDAPVDRVKVAELATRWGALGFLFPKPERPIFGNDQVAVTRKAADYLADCFNKLVDKNRLGGPIERDDAQRFILQMLVALFAEDIDLLPRYRLAHLLDACKTKQDSRDLLGGLFEAMNTREKTIDDRYGDVDYFNGGLFAVPARLALGIGEVDLLKAAAKEDWSKVRPEIFGTLFEHSLGAKERHSLGAHFTHPTDIMKIVGPTIVEPWRKVIEEADSLKRLRTLWQRMQDYTVLDPACGSGNFLYTAYRELKRLEARIFERMSEISTGFDPNQRLFGFISARQFFGLDINPFAVELAKVTMMIARKLAIDELHITEPALPLDNLDANFKVADALIDDLGHPTRWPAADVIIGNPPFLGAKRLKPERGPDYVNTLRKAYPEVPGMADYCVYWFRKAHDLLPECTADDPVSGRAGLVGTQNIRNNQSRVGGLDHIVKTGTIIEAVDNQPWSGEANVHVSIANWVKTLDVQLLPSQRILWFRATTTANAPRIVAQIGQQMEQDQELSFLNSECINSSLSSLPDTSKSFALMCNAQPKRVFQGVTPGHEGFLLTPEEYRDLLRDDPKSKAAIFPYLIGRELLTGNGKPERYIIDFEQRGLLDCQEYPGALRRVQTLVLAARKEKAELGKDADGELRPHHRQFLERWWKLSWDRADLIKSISRLDRYLVCSRVTKRPIFVFIGKEIRPGDALQAFVFADDYSFGILQSDAHWQWFVAKCSKLKSDFRYTPESVFDTFPWPQAPSVARIDAVAMAGREVRRVREEALSKMTGGLRAVYRSLELPGKHPLKEAHAALDAAVIAAYGFAAKGDMLAQLLALNLEVARRETAGEAVTSPGIPAGYPDPARLVSDDCIRAMLTST